MIMKNKETLEKLRTYQIGVIRSVIASRQGRLGTYSADATDRERLADTDGLAGKAVLLAHVAAEDLHGGDAEREREERLVESRAADGQEAVFLHFAEVGLKIEGKPFSDAGEGKGVHDKDKQDGEEADHQELHKTLNAVLQAEEADKGANGHRDGHARYLKPRILGHGSKELSHRCLLYTSPSPRDTR